MFLEEKKLDLEDILYVLYVCWLILYFSVGRCMNKYEFM